MAALGYSAHAPGSATALLIDLSETVNQPARRKTAVRAVVVELHGPQDAVLAWAKSVDRGKMLGLIKE